MSTLALRNRKTQIFREPEIDLDDIQRHTNLYWLCGEMERLAQDVIDREICRRLRQFAGRIEYDFPSEVIHQIRSRRREVDTVLIPEGLLPFYRHYAFMIQRQKKEADERRTALTG